MSDEPNGYTRMFSILGGIAAMVGVMGSMLAWIYSLQDRVTRGEAALIEIETQFCAADIARNLMHANDLRNYSVLYRAVLGQDYPVGNAYYPTICNRAPRR